MHHIAIDQCLATQEVELDARELGEKARRYRDLEKSRVSMENATVPASRSPAVACGVLERAPRRFCPEDQARLPHCAGS